MGAQGSKNVGEAGTTGNDSDYECPSWGSTEVRTPKASFNRRKKNITIIII